MVVIGGLGRGGSGDPPPASAGLRGPDDPGTVPGAPTIPPDNHVYDLVIKGGRVIDPDSGYDRVADVGIDGATVVAVTEGSLRGTTMVPAGGKIVAPGFIDLLSYEPYDEGASFKIHDGVTTNLGMHGINGHAPDFFDAFTDNCLVNFGGAFDEPWMRYNELDLAVDEEPSADQIKQLADMARAELSQGWIGIDLEPEYAPGTTFEEMLAHGRRRPGARGPVLLPRPLLGRRHQRRDARRDHRDRQAVGRGVSTSSTSSAPAAPSTWRRRSPGSRRPGTRAIDITACMYPYNYWATYIQSPRFDDGWQERFRITYSDLQVAGTSERLNEATFDALRGGSPEDNKLTVAFAIPEADVDACIQAPWVMIGSDAILTNGNNHPRATGCFARTLGRVRPREGPHLLVGGAGQDDDPPGPAARGEGAGAAEARAACSGAPTPTSRSSTPTG